MATIKTYMAQRKQQIFNSRHCKVVPRGFKSNALRNSIGGCPQGTYGKHCQNACPPGYQCLQGISEPIACPPGTYSSNAVCIECPAAHYCPNNYEPPIAVGQGYFAKAGSFTRFPCPPGMSCQADGTKFTPLCVYGFYHNGNECVECPAGHECRSVLQQPYPCQRGYYSPPGQMICFPCPGGKSCTPDGQMTNCGPGQYTQLITDVCTPSKAGYRLILPTSNVQQICMPGTYQNLDRSSCRPCPAGYSCTYSKSYIGLQEYNFPKNDQEATPCPIGTYAPTGSGICRPCQAGTNCKKLCEMGEYTLPDQFTCLVCPPGFYCPDPSLQPHFCPAGHYQPYEGKNTKCQIVDLGSYAGFGTHAQIECPPGYECRFVWDPPKPCLPGYYSGGGLFQCKRCADGRYCPFPASQSDVTLCPQNMYCRVRTYGAQPEYNRCPAGTEYIGKGAKLPSDCSICSPGFYCELGERAKCPAGYYCEAGTFFRHSTPCPEGTFLNFAGAKSATECQPCPKGKFCPRGSTLTQDCPYGFGCPAGADFSESECTPGYYSEYESKLDKACTLCPKAHFCPPRCMKALPCEPGYYGTTEGMRTRKQCKLCPVGKACPNAGTINPLECADGHYCPIGTEAPMQFPCPYGTYAGGVRHLESRSQCQPCPPGRACLLGMFDLKDTHKCQPGYACPGSNSSPYSNPCFGSYNPDFGSASCIICPAGHYCPVKSRTPFVCEPGYYCPEGTALMNTHPCPDGTYNPVHGATSEADCIPAPQFYYITRGSQRYSICPAGFSCPEGSSFPMAVFGSLTTLVIQAQEGEYAPRPAKEIFTCPEGTYSGAAQTHCLSCPLDFFCPAGSKLSDILSQRCPAGSSCPPKSSDSQPCGKNKVCLAGLTVPLFCPPGTYTEQGTDSRDACTSVIAGYYSPAMSSLSPLPPCEPGYYCTGKASTPFQHQCPQGTYLRQKGATSIQACLPCEDGYLCPPGTAHPRLCPEGFTCSQGIATPCAPGFYQDQQGQTQCKPCTEGRVCSTTGLTVPDFLCAPGHGCTSTKERFRVDPPDEQCGGAGFCQMGTASRRCPPGTIPVGAELQHPHQCTPCQAGFYCNGLQSLPCESGFYCTAGSSEPQQHIAPPGTFTRAAATEVTECPPGYYQSMAGQDNCDTPCQAGFYCPDARNDGTLRQLCPLGKYCLGGTFSPQSCPTGTLGLRKGLKSALDCAPCPPGRACPVQGTSSVEQLPLCDPGYYCERGAVSMSPEDSTQGKYGPCPSGYYCPKGSSEPHPCPAGTILYTPLNSRLQNCEPCPAGKYCPKEGMSSAPLDCDAGYYCPPGSKLPRSFGCSPGYKCPQASKFPIACDHGEYQPHARGSRCLPCPTGFECRGLALTEPTPCPKGGYCETGGIFTLCPLGTYQSLLFQTSADSCRQCLPGKECMIQGLGLNPVELPDCQEGYFCSPQAQNAKQACVAGYHCPLGSAQPLPCPGGKYCPDGTHVYNCPAGYYCREKTTIRYPTDLEQHGGELCPAEHYCPVGSDSPIWCPAGTYSSKLGAKSQDDCHFCDAGKSCIYKELLIVRDCAQGYYCPSGLRRNTPYPSTHKCGPDQFCLGGPVKYECQLPYEYQPNSLQSECFDCPEGYVCTSQGFQDCNQDNRHFCSNGQDIIRCPRGTYSISPNADSIEHCVRVPAGYILAAETGIQLSPCPPGYYCPSATPSPLPCPMGHYCPEGSAMPQPCKPGHYCSDFGSPEPTGLCDAGFYCTGGADHARQHSCLLGHYCPVGSVSPKACPIGTFLDLLEQDEVTDCRTCPPGKYCDQLGLVTPLKPCPPGRFCNAASQSPTGEPCPPGNMCPSSSSQAIPCPKGTYQPYSMQTLCLDCPAGFYCQNQATSLTIVCPEGKYCPQGTIIPEVCPQGTFNSKRGLKTAIDCQPCPPGRYCDNKGLMQPSGPCEAGKICTGQAKGPNDGYSCPQGMYCLAGALQPTPCPIGTYSDNIGNTSPDGCLPCPIGYFCDRLGATFALIKGTANKCNAGYYCTGGATTPSPTSIGGDFCSPGKFCLRGALEEIDCPPGTYNPHKGQAACQPCPVGRKCSKSGLLSFEDCDAGHYCPTIRTVNPLPCNPGTYSPRTNLERPDQCIACDPGKYCEGGQAQVSGDCDPGFTCPGGASSPNPSALFSFFTLNPGLCPPGHYCPPANTMPIPCGEGSYQDVPSQDDPACKPCPAGHYCDEKGMSNGFSFKCEPGFLCVEGQRHPKPRPCSKGYFCPKGTDREVPCPGGTYEAREGSRQCQPCPQGYYCPSPVSPTDSGTIVPIACSKTNYCKEGTAVPTPCPDGTYSTTEKLESEEQCAPCSTGRYCQQGKEMGLCNAGYFCHKGSPSAAPDNMPCPVGHYCLEGTVEPTVCPKGKVRNLPGGASPEDCGDCQEGMYCIPGDPVSHPCPRGHYCPKSRTPPEHQWKPIECPAGTYNDEMRRYDRVEHCPPCPGGFLCMTPGVSDLAKHLCPPGHYCNPGSNYTTPCPPGTYNPEQGKGSIQDCKPCEEGYYCPEKSQWQQECLPGYYCPPGAKEQIICPVGSYCPPGITEHIPCPKGFLCNATGLVKYADCPLGYFCDGLGATGCPPGSRSSGNSIRTSYETACKLCERGEYTAVAGSIRCEPCPPGYLCYGGTNTNIPSDLFKHFGQECPPGYFCPQGSWEKQPCPLGTYNSEWTASRLEQCLSCPLNSYAHVKAAPECIACGEYALTMKVRQTGCICIGKYRTFATAYATCPCSVTHTHDNRFDGIQDCQPQVFPVCGSDQTLDHLGSCQSLTNSCQRECPDGKGRRMRSTGLCECQILDPPLEDMCDQLCLAALPSYSLNVINNELLLSAEQPPLNFTDIPRSWLTNVFGSPSCVESTAGRQQHHGCAVHVLHLDSARTSYIASPLMLPVVESQLFQDGYIRGTSESRSLQSVMGIRNALLCLYEGETVLFELDMQAGSYPVYAVDSLLNTNFNFDYKQFFQVASQPSTMTAFAFTFVDEGTYVITNSLDSSKITVLEVKDQHRSCPVPALATNTQQHLSAAGVAIPPKLIYDINWALFVAVLVVLSCIVFLLLLCIYYYKKKSWTSYQAEEVPYREDQKEVRFEEIKLGVTPYRPLPLMQKEERPPTPADLISLFSDDSMEQRRLAKKEAWDAVAFPERTLDLLLSRARTFKEDFTVENEQDHEMQQLIGKRVKEMTGEMLLLQGLTVPASDSTGASKMFPELEQMVQKQMQMKMSHTLRCFESEEGLLLREHRLRSQGQSEEYKVKLVKLFRQEEPNERLEILYMESGELVKEEIEAEQRRQRDCLRGVLEKWRTGSVKAIACIAEMEQKKEELEVKIRNQEQVIDRHFSDTLEQCERELEEERSRVLAEVEQRADRRREEKRDLYGAHLSNMKKLLEKLKMRDKEALANMVEEYVEDSEGLEDKLTREKHKLKGEMAVFFREEREKKRLLLEHERRRHKEKIQKHYAEELQELERLSSEGKSVLLAFEGKKNERVCEEMDLRMRQVAVRMNRLQETHRREIQDLLLEQKDEIDSLERNQEEQSAKWKEKIRLAESRLTYLPQLEELLDQKDALQERLDNEEDVEKELVECCERIAVRVEERRAELIEMDEEMAKTEAEALGEKVRRQDAHEEAQEQLRERQQREEAKVRRQLEGEMLEQLAVFVKISYPEEERAVALQSALDYREQKEIVELMQKQFKTKLEELSRLFHNIFNSLAEKSALVGKEAEQRRERVHQVAKYIGAILSERRLKQVRKEWKMAQKAVEEEHLKALQSLLGQHALLRLRQDNAATIELLKTSLAQQKDLFLQELHLPLKEVFVASNQEMEAAVFRFQEVLEAVSRREEERVGHKLEPILETEEEREGMISARMLEIEELSEDEALESNRKLLTHEISPRKRELVISAKREQILREEEERERELNEAKKEERERQKEMLKEKLERKAKQREDFRLAEQHRLQQQEKLQEERERRLHKLEQENFFERVCMRHEPELIEKIKDERALKASLKEEYLDERKDSPSTSHLIASLRYEGVEASAYEVIGSRIQEIEERLKKKLKMRNFNRMNTVEEVHTPRASAALIFGL